MLAPTAGTTPCSGHAATRKGRCTRWSKSSGWSGSGSPAPIASTPGSPTTTCNTIEDGHGHDCAYYSLNGVPVTAPTAPAAYLCPACGASRIHITLLARRDIPLAPYPAADTTWPRQVDTAQRRITRHQAPLLPGQQPPTRP